MASEVPSIPNARVPRSLSGTSTYPVGILGATMGHSIRVEVISTATTQRHIVGTEDATYPHLLQLLLGSVSLALNVQELKIWLEDGSGPVGACEQFSSFYLLLAGPWPLPHYDVHFTPNTTGAPAFQQGLQSLRGLLGTSLFSKQSTSTY